MGAKKEVRVPIRAETLRWAMERARVDESELARAVGVARERVLAWSSGSERPTHAQVHRIARKLDIAFSGLLSPPPERDPELPLRDFRRGNRSEQPPSLELRAVVLDAVRKRDWYREYRARTNPVVGLFRERSAAEAADWASRELEIEAIRRDSPTWSTFRSRLADAIENRLDVLVLRNSVVGNNTHRPLDENEFAGFALADPIAPLIFVNTRGSVARSIFTLAHELGHVLAAEDALDSDPFLDIEENLDTGEDRERFCDRFAAELLMPEQDFRSAWSEAKDEDLDRRCDLLAARFRVSARAVLVRARALHLVPKEAFDEARKRIQGREKRTEDHGTERGGNFWTNLARKNSKRFLRAVIEATRNGDLTYTYGARLLGIGPDALVTIINDPEKVIHA
ncbi:MAG: ImmA/IrrE family metallo-endopeptidase [Geminicoccaceae bacterium]|nr:ImmA/IrrE family metallo-endopeptidase [Geminicoccaceae bacterium]